MMVYLGLGLIACATLVFEVALTRLLSVTTWYHLAFLAISTAMLGMTAGAVRVYLRPDIFEPDQVARRAANTSLVYALAVTIALAVLCLLPVMAPDTTMGALSLLVTAAVAALPFYCAGIVVTVVLTKTRYPVGLLYSSDLAGAAAGCLLALICLETLDAPSAILVSAAIGLAAGAAFSRSTGSSKRASMAALGAVVLVGLAVLNSSSTNGIGPVVAKGEIQLRSAFEWEKWNSYSRVALFPLDYGAPQYWGASPKAPSTPVQQYHMNIDGEAGTTARGFSSLADIDHLRYDVTSFVHYLRPSGNACVIGVGGGRDVQDAILFGHANVLGIDVNRTFIDLHRGRFRSFTGLADRPDVTLVTDEARSYLARHPERYDVIQMSLIDTWAATGSGAFSLSENGLYTLEAWKLFLSRLSDNGVFTVSRWFNPVDLGETGRMLSLATAALFESGAAVPAQHLAMVSSRRVATLLVSRQPLTPEEIARIRKAAADLEFVEVIIPGQMPTHPALRNILAAQSVDDLHRRIADSTLRYDPPTDDSPYFFNMLRLSDLRSAFDVRPGVVRGNLLATYNLVVLVGSLALLCIATVVLPLLKRAMSTQGAPSVLWSAAVYFSMIGAGFMFLEIGLMQRLSVFLGHPIYGLGVLLFAIIASAGLGSLVSEKLLPGNPSRLIWLPPVMALLIVGGNFGIQLMMAYAAPASTLQKIVLSVLAVFPQGVLLGVFFPAGMRLVRVARGTETPWYWALNGVFGVLCSALAVFVSIQFSISANFFLAAACYLGLMPFLKTLVKAGRAVEASS